MKITTKDEEATTDIYHDTTSRLKLDATKDSALETATGIYFLLISVFILIFGALKITLF